MKLNKTLLITALSLFAASGLMANQNAKKEEVPGVAAQPASYFYTGKPYDADLGAYTFNYRNYDPAVARWTSADPSGFPDGANNQIYTPVPTSAIDPLGLVTQTITYSGNWTTLSVWTQTWQLVSGNTGSTTGTSTSTTNSGGVSVGTNGGNVNGGTSTTNGSSSGGSAGQTYAWVTTSSTTTTAGTQASQFTPSVPTGWTFGGWIVNPKDTFVSSSVVTCPFPASNVQMIADTESYTCTAQYTITE